LHAIFWDCTEQRLRRHFPLGDPAAAGADAVDGRVWGVAMVYGFRTGLGGDETLAVVDA